MKELDGVLTQLAVRVDGISDTGIIDFLVSIRVVYLLTSWPDHMTPPIASCPRSQ